jgi:hypothetical protein
MKLNKTEIVQNAPHTSIRQSVRQLLQLVATQQTELCVGK